MSEKDEERCHACELVYGDPECKECPIFKRLKAKETTT
jgi:hypothetical protein